MSKTTRMVAAVVLTILGITLLCVGHSYPAIAMFALATQINVAGWLRK